MALNIKAIFPVLVHPVDTEDEESIKIVSTDLKNPDEGHQKPPHTNPRLLRKKKTSLLKKLNIIK